MAKMLITLTILCAVVTAQVSPSYSASDDGRQVPDDSSTFAVNQVLQWNKVLLVIVRTPGAQPATIHPTRSFAIMHAAIMTPSTPLIEPTGPTWFILPRYLQMLHKRRQPPRQPTKSS